MPDWVPAVASAIAIAMASGLVGWVWALWQAHNALRIKVAEDHPKNGALTEIKNEIRDLRDVVYRIANRLEVPVLRRD